MTTTETTKTPNASKTVYRALLQNIVCDRYAAREDALAAIEICYERRQITTVQFRDLEARIG